MPEELPTYALLASTLLAAACLQHDGGSRTGTGDVVLRYRLEAGATYTAGGPAALVFTLENRSGQALRVLTWYTPLEGLKGRILKVTRGGQELLYRGRMVKRGAPRAEDYLPVGPGASTSATFDLAAAYDLSAPGQYRVEFVGRVHDVALPGEAVPRPVDRQRGIDVPGDPAEFRVVAGR